MPVETTRIISIECVRYTLKIIVASMEMWIVSKIGYSCLLIGIITIMLFIIPRSSADVPPPIEYVQTDSGGLFSLANNVSMPNAEVNVTIHLSGNWYYSINVSCSFNISSQTNQNLTTAFVYPGGWYDFAYPGSSDISRFNIRVNETLVNHTILSFDEFRDGYDVNQTEWGYLDDCYFALFNFSIISNEPLLIGVVTDFEVYSPGHEYIFQYIVDTARAWEGDTHETVIIDFTRDLDTQIIRYYQSPNDSLDFFGTNYTASMIWDFDISDFLHDRVTFGVQQREYPIYTHHFPPTPFLWIPVTMAAIVVVGIVFYLSRRNRF